jgi:hypothetical protein
MGGNTYWTCCDQSVLKRGCACGQILEVIQDYTKRNMEINKGLFLGYYHGKRVQNGRFGTSNEIEDELAIGFTEMTGILWYGGN